MIGAIILLSFVTAERVVELWLARRNTKRLMQAGGIEHAARHYPLLILFHAVWLVGLWLVAWDRPLNLVWLGVFAILQMARAWVVVTLGNRFTTRIITVPGEALVRRGPYQFMHHPNYGVVVAEIAVLPMVFGLWQYAIIFSIGNLGALSVRIPAEDRALANFRHD